MSIKVSDLGISVSEKIKSAIFPNGILVEGDFVTPLIPLMTDPKLAPEVGAVISKINSLKESIKDAEIASLKNTVTQVKKSKGKKELNRESFPTDAGFWNLIKGDWQSIVASLFNSPEDKELMTTYFSSGTSYSLGSRIRAKCGYFGQHLITDKLYEGVKWNPAKKLSKEETALLQKQVLIELGYEFDEDESIEVIFQKLGLDTSAKKTYDNKFKEAKRNLESQGFYSLTDPSKKAVIHRKAMTLNLIKSLDLYEFQVNHGLALMYLMYLTLQEIFTQDSWEQKQLIMKPSDFTSSLVNEEDWDWLTGKTEDSIFNKYRTVKFSIDKSKLETVYLALKDKGAIYSKPFTNLDTNTLTVSDFDIEGLFALLMFIQEASDLSKGNLETLVKSLGVKKAEIQGDNHLKQNEYKPNPVTTKKSKITA